jgi:hypothetical protein
MGLAFESPKNSDSWLVVRGSTHESRITNHEPRLISWLCGMNQHQLCDVMCASVGRKTDACQCVCHTLSLEAWKKFVREHDV